MSGKGGRGLESRRNLSQFQPGREGHGGVGVEGKMETSLKRTIFLLVTEQPEAHTKALCRWHWTYSRALRG